MLLEYWFCITFLLKECDMDFKRIPILLGSFALLTSSTCFAADNLKEMFSQGSVNGELRSYYYDRDFDSTQKEREDYATGGLFGYKSAALKGVSFGVTFATVNDTGSSDGKAVYGLLPKDQNGNHDSVTRMQEMYVQGQWFNTTLKYGGQMINTPFMNGNDIRLLPKSYKGASVINKSIPNLELQGYFITGYMGWADDDYTQVSDSAAKTADESKPMLIGGAKYKLPVNVLDVSAEGWLYSMSDVMDMTYYKVTAAKQLGDFKLSLEPTYFTQKSKGDELAGNLDSDQIGVAAGASAYGISLNAYYAKTGDTNLLTPWGDSRVINQQVLASQFAKEEAIAAKIGYDFGQLGLKGLSAYVLYGVYNAPEINGKTTDANEMNYNIQYDFGKNFGGILDGFSVRARYAVIDNKDADDYTDTRIYLRYTFALAGK